ncbi:dehydrogenase [Prauserella marina]|uniref:Anaerobic selenocysteine-containing dehydrogenase n=1 Tax=Prauserella marina TaxID=530584 RepID=A0A222VIF9_9PSEU|nr:molybdopterin oxidoreductase family protein [Prauserella marina]ASR33709.1 dehydrogenase [Prauserella marina]PWV82266.1 anaerobic selenocysteine-containing dehydrogenase [Prauserella marina]SDC64734.1 Anaerobic selenocysteine-containing dehydrogenase [Prauserella marina]
MATTHHHTCTLCEATCGITVSVDGGRVTAIRGDELDPLSRGFLCPKGVALADVHHDPDRLRRPIVRSGDDWFETSWDAAFELVAAGLTETRREHGKDALAVYQGNPTAHNLGLLLFGQPFFRSLGTRNRYSATSLDQLPHMLAALEMFGNQLLMPVPDVDRTDLFVCFGGNPAVSAGSIMTAPDIRARLRAVRKVVVVDPRRTETARLADEHLFIRPGTDALLLLSLINVVFAERRECTGRLTSRLVGFDIMREVASGFAPEVTAPVTGVDPGRVRALAREIAGTPRAVVYGRVGVCTQEFGGLATWLVVVLNALTGHLDEPGGAMFTTPAVDVLPLSSLTGQRGGFGRYHSRVRRLPEFDGELPVSTLADEIETPGRGQVRALITVAGNPVLSSPNGRRLDTALAGLDFMVSIDPYLNETTRHADVILPPTVHLERSHYELGLANYAVRNTARYSPPVVERASDQRHDWEIVLQLASRVLGGGALARTLGGFGPEPLLSLGLLAGPHGLRKLHKGLSLGSLKRRPHGVDLGPLERRLPARLATRGKKINLVPKIYLDDVPRLRALLDRPVRDGLVLIGRRQVRSNNSWMHNSERLVKGKDRCTLLVHPDDADERGLADGDLAVLSSAVGTIEVPVEITDTVMRGVVSLPHGWGHDRKGTRLRVAERHPGVSVNDVTDERLVDELTGAAVLSGIPVSLAAPSY